MGRSAVISSCDHSPPSSSLAVRPHSSFLIHLTLSFTISSHHNISHLTSHSSTYCSYHSDLISQLSLPLNPTCRLLSCNTSWPD
jgi:hypothetical protein